MITIILPGFSLYNKAWVEEIKEKVKLDHPIEIIYWEHWEQGGGLKLKKELEKIEKIVKDDKFNIIAKSVGTGVVVRLLSIYEQKINKIIFCGIPSISEKRMQKLKEALEGFNFNNLTCIQNTKDPFVSFKDLRNVLKEISPEILLIEKPAKDHNYPYFQDFQEILK